MSDLPKSDLPVSFNLDFLTGDVTYFSKLTQRRVSNFQSMFYDRQAAQYAVDNGDPLIYEFYDTKFMTTTSDMAIAITRIFPGKIGDEYFMSKGHQHISNDQPEMYICTQGTGFLLLDTLEGEFRAEPWAPGTITHIPPIWAHRAVNTGNDILVYIGVYHASAGHNYDLVEKQGFSQVVIERGGKPTLVPHP